MQVVEPPMDMRELKALEIAAKFRIVFDKDAWVVPSQSSSAKYRVVLGLMPEADTCTCEDWTLRRSPCKHSMAVRIVAERDGRAKSPVIVCDEVPKRKTYAQKDWPAYNLHQRIEGHRVKVLLHDLCHGIPEPLRTGKGRTPVPLADRLFAVCYKVYSTFSSRRCGTNIDDAVEDGFLSRPLHSNKVNCFMDLAEMTPYLHTILERSALPMRAIETRFAPDSSGFSVSKFVKWFDEKYGRERSGKDWVKVHLIVGCQTGIITSAAIYGRDTNDSPILPELVNATAKNFTVREVPADKGYLSGENVDAIHAVGAMPFIAPKSSTTGGIGGLFEKMYHYYLYRREDFLDHYHQRSMVESVFSAVKRKFGDNVRSRSETAKTNEVLAKLICYNLTRVILSQCELGIEAEFWHDDEVTTNDDPNILSMVRPG